MKLYELPDALRAAFDALEVDEETGEIVNGEALERVEAEARDKLEGTALYMRELDADAKGLAEEIARLQARKRSIERRTEWLRQYMRPALDAMGGKLKTPRATIYKMHTQKVVLDCKPDNLPQAFQKLEVKADLAGLKKALKGGEKIQGAYLVDNESIVIR